MDKIKYMDGYKYQLKEDYAFTTKILCGNEIETKFIGMTRLGVLLIRSGYAWDGCSGPTWDDKTNMRGGLIHDVLYQLMREGYLSASWRWRADEILKEVCIADGMFRPRAWAYYQAVKYFAEGYSKAFLSRKPKEAP